MRTTDTLKIDTSWHETGLVVSLAGSASMDLCDQLNAALLEACQSKPQMLVINLAELTFICSLGLGGLVAAYLRVQKYGGRLALACPSQAIREMLEVTKLGTLLPVYDTSQQALAGV